jgi:hypothetical protein
MEGMEKLLEIFRNKSHSEIKHQVKEILISESFTFDTRFINELIQYLTISDNDSIESISLELIHYLFRKNEYLFLLEIIPKLKILKSYRYKYQIEASEHLGKISYSKKTRIEYIEFLLNKKNYELSEKIIKNSQEKYHKDYLFKLYALNLYHDLAHYELLYNEFLQVRMPLHKKNIKKTNQIDEKEIINYLQNIFKNQEIKELRYNIIMREISLHKTHLELRDHIKNDLKKNELGELLEAIIWGKDDLCIMTLVLKILWVAKEYELAQDLFLSIEKRNDFNFLNEIKNDNELKRIIFELRDQNKIKDYVSGTDIRIRFDKMDDLFETETHEKKEFNVEKILSEYKIRDNDELDHSDLHLARIIESEDVESQIEEICMAALQAQLKKSIEVILQKDYKISDYLKLQCLKFLEKWGEALIICDHIIQSNKTDLIYLREVVFERGMIFIKLNKKSNAKKDLKILIQISASQKKIEKLENEIKKNE